jgi:hypothetical protein
LRRQPVALAFNATASSQAAYFIFPAHRGAVSSLRTGRLSPVQGIGGRYQTTWKQSRFVGALFPQGRLSLQLNNFGNKAAIELQAPGFYRLARPGAGIHALREQKLPQTFSLAEKFFRARIKVLA